MLRCDMHAAEHSRRALPTIAGTAQHAAHLRQLHIAHDAVNAGMPDHSMCSIAQHSPQRTSGSSTSVMKRQPMFSWIRWSAGGAKRWKEVLNPAPALQQQKNCTGCILLGQVISRGAKTLQGGAQTGLQCNIRALHKGVFSWVRRSAGVQGGQARTQHWNTPSMLGQVARHYRP